jgi:hypothetical protein
VGSLLLASFSIDASNISYKKLIADFAGGPFAVSAPFAVS